MRNPTIYAIWRRNRSRLARFCDARGNLVRRVPQSVRLAYRRDNAVLCRIGPRVSPKTFNRHCAEVRRGTYCPRWRTRHRSARCFCALAKNRLLP